MPSSKPKSYEDSFASHPRALNWDPVKNGDKTPRDFTKCSQKKAYFKCDKCPHTFENRIGQITILGRWCAYCVNQKLCDDKNCDICHNKSFASHPRALNWDPIKNGDKTPRDIFKCSGKKAWFKCDKCPHTFDSSLANIKKGNWCPYCNNKKLCDDKECKICYNKSFASHPRAAHWHPTENGNKTPRDMFKITNKKACFKCPECNNNYYSRVSHVVKGTWCSCVNKKTEALFHKFLLENKKIFNIKSIKKTFRPKWANFKKTHNTFYEYDFYIVLNNGVEIIIEIDGPQHYKQVSNWNIPLRNQIRDRIKEMLAVKQKINVLRLNQEDICNNVNDWEKNFIDFVEDRYKDNNERIRIYDCADGDRYYKSTNTNSD